MRKSATFAGLAVFVLSAGAGLLGGCSAESNPSLTLMGLRGFEVGEDGCAPNMEEEVYLASVGFDAGLSAAGFGAFKTSVEVVNNMPSSEDLEAGRLDANDVQLTHVVVTFDSTGPWSFLKGESRTVPLGAIVTSAGKVVAPVAAIDSELSKLLIEGDGTTPSPIAAEGSSRELVVNFKAHGKFPDGTEIESNELGLLLTVFNNGLGCPVGTEALGCSGVQGDMFKCVAPEEPAAP